MANTNEPPKATTCVSNKNTTWPTVSKPKSVPRFIQLSIMVPTPSIYKKKAIKNYNTFLSYLTILFKEAKIFKKAFLMLPFSSET